MLFCRRVKSDLLIAVIVASVLGALVLGIYLNHWATQEYYKQNFIFEQDCDRVDTKFGLVEICAKKVTDGKSEAR